MALSFALLVVSAGSVGYFDVLRVTPRQGRVFTPGDTADSLPVAVVSESIQRADFPAGAVGQQIRVVQGAEVHWRAIVGVVQDVQEMDLGPSVTTAVYVVMAFAVSKRTSEIGVRMAIGADTGQVMRMVLAQGARQVALGIVVGLGLAALLARAMQIMFFQIGPYDPRAFGAVAVLLLATGMAAAFVPARRASRVDPMTALRSQ